MGKFSYKVKDLSGKTLTGTIEAADTRMVSTMLRDQGLFVINIQASLPSFVFSRIAEPFRRIDTTEITNFTRQLAVMVSTGLTLTEALTVLNNQTTNPNFKKLLSDLIVQIEGGWTFSKALSKYNHVFPDIYIAVVHSGETSGLLGQMLNRLAENLEKDREFHSKTKGALVYPIIVFIGMGLVMAIMMIFVVPQLSTLYDQLNIDLPLPTKIVVAISNFFVAFWYIFLVAVFILFIVFSSWKKTETGKYTMDAFVLKIPVWGKLQQYINITELTRTLGLLVGTGTPIIEAIGNVGQSAKNRLFAEAMERVGKKIEKGLTVGAAFSQEPNIPVVVAQMARVGEETGKMDEVMIKISQFFESEAEYMIKTLTTLLEPIIMVVLGVGVGFLIVSVILPIYSLLQAF